MSIDEEKLIVWMNQTDKKLAHLEANQMAIINGDFCDTNTEPKEPLIKDEKIRKAIKYIFPECGLIHIEKQGGSRIFRFGGTRLEIYAPDENAITHGCTYLVTELCGEGEGC